MTNIEQGPPSFKAMNDLTRKATFQQIREAAQKGRTSVSLLSCLCGTGLWNELEQQGFTLRCSFGNTSVYWDGKNLD